MLCLSVSSDLPEQHRWRNHAGVLCSSISLSLYELYISCLHCMSYIFPVSHYTDYHHIWFYSYSIFNNWQHIPLGPGINPDDSTIDCKDCSPAIDDIWDVLSHIPGGRWTTVWSVRGSDLLNSSSWEDQAYRCLKDNLRTIGCTSVHLEDKGSGSQPSVVGKELKLFIH